MRGLKRSRSQPDVAAPTRLNAPSTARTLAPVTSGIPRSEQKAIRFVLISPLVENKRIPKLRVSSQKSSDRAALPTVMLREQRQEDELSRGIGSAQQPHRQTASRDKPAISDCRRRADPSGPGADPDHHSQVKKSCHDAVMKYDSPVPAASSSVPRQGVIQVTASEAITELG